MIGAGIVLLAVGGADLARNRLSGRALALVLAGAAIVLLLIAAGADAAAWWFVALAVAALWMLATPTRTANRFGLWPAVLVAAVATGSVAFVGVRPDQGPLGELWPQTSPLAAVSLDVAVAIVGAIVFLLDSGNVIVRAALRDGAVPVDTAAPALKGGRLIGPLERILVLALTLTGAFSLLAAVLAAKGIVRFPEISRDEEGGSRAEYFLVGSLVSWVCALAAAFLIWWGSSV